jgi:hypothetical protein
MGFDIISFGFDIIDMFIDSIHAVTREINELRRRRRRRRKGTIFSFKIYFFNKIFN